MRAVPQIEIAVLPPRRHARFSENSTYEIRKCSLGAYVVRQQQRASAPALDADQGIAGAVVVATLEEARALRAFEHDDTQAGRDRIAALRGRHVRLQGGELRTGVIGSCGCVIACALSADSRLPLINAAANLARSSIVVSIEPAARTVLPGAGVTRADHSRIMRIGRTYRKTT